MLFLFGGHSMESAGPFVPENGPVHPIFFCGKGVSPVVLFWSFFFYGFAGFLLERAFARLTKARLQVRKGFLLLPLCPVYGLGMVVFLGVTEPGEWGWWGLVLRGAILCTLVEYAVHLFYDRLLGVRFWDYEGVFANVWGRVCLPFSLAWGLLSAFSFVQIQPLVERWAALMPRWSALLMALVLAADCVLSWQVLRQGGDPELLSWRNLLTFTDVPPARTEHPDKQSGGSSH